MATSLRKNNKFDDLIFEHPIPEAKYIEVIIFLRKHHFLDEPLIKACGLFPPGGSHSELENYCLETLTSGYSILATDRKSSEIAAVLICDVQRKSEMDVVDLKLKTIQDNKLRQLMRLIHSLDKNLGMFDLFDVNEIFENRILSVGLKYRGRKLGRKMMRLSEAIAREAGFRVVMENCTSRAQQILCANLGHTMVYELLYNDLITERSKHLVKPQPPNTSIQVMAKMIV